MLQQLSWVRRSGTISSGKRAMDKKSSSVNLYYESRTLPDFWDLYDFGRLFVDLVWIYVGFPGNAELRLVLSRV